MATTEALIEAAKHNATPNPDYKSGQHPETFYSLRRQIQSMMDLMKRDPFADSKDPDSQANGFTGKMLADRKITGARLWSKAGWTNKSRHDAAYLEMPDGRKLVLVIFTENHANDREPIPAIAGKVLDRLK